MASKTPPVGRVVWQKARRIVSTRHPPIDLFEDIANPADWDLIAAEECKTNARLRDSIGCLDLVPRDRRVSGPGASYLMAPFTHVSRAWAGRFHDGQFGAFYTANRIETAVAETAHHRSCFYRAAKDAPGWFSQFRELICAIDHDFHDIREDKTFLECLDPDDYGVSQSLAVRLRASNSDGVVYPSVRDPDGECLAAFWPDVIGTPVHGRAFAYHFDGERVDLVRDEISGAVYRV